MREILKPILFFVLADAEQTEVNHTAIQCAPGTEIGVDQYGNADATNINKCLPTSNAAFVASCNDQNRQSVMKIALQRDFFDHYKYQIAEREHFIEETLNGENVMTFEYAATNDNLMYADDMTHFELHYQLEAVPRKDHGLYFGSGFKLDFTCDYATEVSVGENFSITVGSAQEQKSAIEIEGAITTAFTYHDDLADHRSTLYLQRKQQIESDLDHLFNSNNKMAKVHVTVIGFRADMNRSLDLSDHHRRRRGHEYVPPKLIVDYIVKASVESTNTSEDIRYSMMQTILHADDKTMVSFDSESFDANTVQLVVSDPIIIPSDMGNRKNTGTIGYSIKHVEVGVLGGTTHIKLGPEHPGLVYATIKECKQVKGDDANIFHQLISSNEVDLANCKYNTCIDSFTDIKLENGSEWSSMKDIEFSYRSFMFSDAKAKSQLQVMRCTVDLTLEQNESEVKNCKTCKLNGSECQHGSSCQDVTGGMKCHCTSGFKGSRCQVPTPIVDKNVDRCEL